MKKVLSIMLAICMLFVLAACGNNTEEQGAVNDPTVSRQSNSDADSREPKETDAGQEVQKIESNSDTDSREPKETDAGQESQKIESNSDTDSREPKETDVGQEAQKIESNSDTDSREPKETDANQEVQKIDVDLTQLSSTMVYSEVYNMMYSPEDYVGKTVKMNGAFALYCQQMTKDGEPDLNYPFYYACVIEDATACCSQGLEFVLAGEHVYPNDYPELGEKITVVGTFETYEDAGYMYCHLVDAEMSD